MSDKRDFRALLTKLQSHLSDISDRRLLHSSLNEIKPERCSDNSSIDRTLSLFQSLFDQGKISNSHFNDLIETFREIGSDDMVKQLSAYQQNKLETIQSTTLLNDSIINNEESKLMFTDKLGNDRSMSTSANFKQQEPIDSLCISEGHYPLLSFDSISMINEPRDKNRQSILKNWPRRRLLFLIFKIVGALAVLLLFILLFIKKCPKQVKSFPHQQFQDGICATAKWSHYGISVAGGEGSGSNLNQLSYPIGLFLDVNQSIYVADSVNNRIVKWDRGATIGQLVAGGNGSGNANDQLNNPHDIVVDDDGAIYITDTDNERVQLWHLNIPNGHTMLNHVKAIGIARDEQGSLYMVDAENNEVLKWRAGKVIGEVVISQLENPFMLFVDRNKSIYVANTGNNQVIKKDEDKKQVSIISSKYAENGIEQLNKPKSVIVDQSGTVYIADSHNHRIVRWLSGASVSDVIVGGHGPGSRSDQLNDPADLSFDHEGNLYVSDFENHRIQKFTIDKSSC